MQWSRCSGSARTPNPVIRAARASNAATRIIFLTAYRTPSVDEKAHAFGADVLLQKPRPLPELAQTVMALLGV